LNHLTYKERLKQFILLTLKYRRARGVFIEVYKIIHNHYDSNATVNVSLNKNAATRGNRYKINNYTFHYNIRKYSICPGVINVWHSLPDIAVDAEITNTFKARLDKFWRDEDMLYDYRAELTGVGSRSQCSV